MALQALAIIGAVIILGLVTYLAHLLLRLRAQRAAASRTELAHDAHNQQFHDDRLKSLELLCIAALSDDCDLSEACIRVHQLLAYYPGLRAEWPGQTIAAIYEEIHDFATHDARRALPLAERRRQDKERLAIEQRHRDTLLASFEELRGRVLQLQGSRYDIDLARGVKGNDP
jgi:hypothetical protein